MRLEQKVALCAASYGDSGVTLDGSPAWVTAPRRDFAQVRLRNGKGGAVEFSWEAVARIMAGNREFKS